MAARAARTRAWATDSFLLAGVVWWLLLLVPTARAQSEPTAAEKSDPSLAVEASSKSGDGGAEADTTTAPASYSAHARVEPPPTEAFAIREAETEALESSMGPAFSMAEAMPGVVPVFSGVPYLIVRGASPAGSLSYYDGIPVPTLFHLALGPSVVAPELAGPTRFMAGAADVRYAAHLGGVLDRAGPSTRTLAQPSRFLQLSLLDAAGLINVPTKRGALSLSWRYGTPGLMIRALGLDATLGYYDYQLRYQTELSERTSFRLVLMGAQDHLGERTQPADDMDLSFHRLLARVTTRAQRFEMGASLLLSSDASTLGTQLDGNALRSTESVYLSWQSQTLRLRTGAELSGALVELKRGPADPLATGTDPLTSGLARRRDIVLDPQDFLDGQPFASVPNRSRLGGYAELQWTPSPALQLTTGVRADTFISSSHLDAALSPMLRARLFATDQLELHAAGALTHKPRTSPLPVPGLNDVALDRGLEAAVQTELGGALQLDSDTSIEANVFYHRYLDVVYLELILDCQGNTDPATTPGLRDVNNVPDSICRSTGLPTADGDSYGLELFVKRNLTRRLSGFVSYTHGYAHATARDGTDFAPQADVRHIANAVLQYRLGGGWSVGARAHFRTGKVAVNTILDLVQHEITRLHYRLPPFFRLDLLLSYGFRTSFGRMSLSAGLQNATFSREATNRDCMAENSAVTCVVDYQPYIVLPNLSVRASF